jgi:glycosyltransferase involved in cell wall biosynthesis
MLSQALLARYCVRSGTPLIWHIKDLYPESWLAKLPSCVSKSVAAPLVSLDRWIVRQAEKTVVLSESLRRVYLDDRGLPTERVLTVQDWVDEQRFARLPERAEACARYDVPEDRFTFLYLGNIGPVAGVELLIEAFHAARLPQAQLVIAGGGSAKAACMELARRLGAVEVRFVSDPEAKNVPLLQSLAHVCLLPVKKGAAISSIPSKLIAYLLSAKPVLATLDAASDTARCIREAECGWVGEPEQVPWLAHKMAEVVALPAAELEAMGQRARAYGLKFFSKAQGVPKLAGVILTAQRNGKIEHAEHP